MVVPERDWLIICGRMRARASLAVRGLETAVHWTSYLVGATERAVAEIERHDARIAQMRLARAEG